MPHEWFAFARQVGPSQQPSGQLAAVQAQAPATHAWSAAQAVQTAPFTPQNWSLVPALQAVPPQQPAQTVPL